MGNIEHSEHVESVWIDGVEYAPVTQHEQIFADALVDVHRDRSRLRQQLKGAVACRDALAKLVRSEWPKGQTLAEIAETHRFGFDYEITDDEMAALREWGQ